HSITLKGIAGTKKIESMMETFRNEPFQTIDNLNVIAMEDYDKGIRTYFHEEKAEEIHLPKSNVIKFLLEDNCWICVRPSGTEPKIKFYFGVKGNTFEESNNRLLSLKKAVLD